MCGSDGAGERAAINDRVRPPAWPAHAVHRPLRRIRPGSPACAPRARAAGPSHRPCRAAREGALVLRLVLAGGLAQLFGTGFDIEDVIADLEGQAECIGETVELGQLRFVGVAAQRTHAHRRADQCAGLQCMHAGQCRQGLLLAGGIDVQRLAATHARGAGRVGQGLQAGHAQRGRQWRVGQQAEGAGLQRIAGQDGGRFVEGDMGGRLAAAQGVIVHRRQVVMHQRIGVDELDGHRRRVQVFRLRAEQVATGVHQQRAHALAAAQHRIAHRLVQALRCFGRRGQGGVELAFDTVAPAREQNLSRHGWADRKARMLPVGPDR